MSVSAYTGLPGSGKSYGVVENVILPCLEQGRPIVTNLPLKLGELQAWCKAKKVPQPRIDIIDLEEVAGSEDQGFLTLRYGAVHVFDEIWRIWPNGMKASQADKSHREYFAEHRHQVDAAGRSTEIVLITQDLSQISNWVRQFVDETYRAQKLNHVGLDKAYRIDVYQGPVTGHSPPQSRMLRQFAGTYKKEVYTLYQSATKAQNTGMHGAGKEIKADSRANILRSPKIWLSLVLGPIVGVGGLWWVLSSMADGSLFGGKPVDKPAPVVEPRPQPTPPQVFRVGREGSNQPVQPKPSVAKYVDPDSTLPPLSEYWKMVGDVRIPDGNFYVVSNGVGYRYLDPNACHDYPGGYMRWCYVDGGRVDVTSGRQLGGFARTPDSAAL